MRSSLIVAVALLVLTLSAMAAQAQTCPTTIGFYGQPLTGTQQPALGAILRYAPLPGGGIDGADGGAYTTECTWFPQGYEAADGQVSGRVWIYNGPYAATSGSFVITLDPVAFPAGGGGNGINYPHAECHVALGVTGDDYASGYPNPWWPAYATVQEGRNNNTPVTYTDPEDGAVLPPNSVEFLWQAPATPLQARATYAFNIFCVSKASQHP
jgi:hypothetical protein